MNILLLAAANDIHTVRWANKLFENGHTVHLCYLKNHKPRIDSYLDGVNLYALNTKSPIGYYFGLFELKKIIKKINPDLMNVHYASGYGTLGRLVDFHPIVLSVYGSDVYDFPYKRRINMRIIKKNIKSADFVASTSFVMKEQINKVINKSYSKKIYITPFGVDINNFKNYSNTVDFNGKIIIGSIKKLSNKYGMEYGIRSIKYLLDNVIDVTLKDKIEYHIYGEGDQKKYLKDLVKELDIDKVVKFKGKIPNNEVPLALNSFSIFLGTSILNSESFGVAIVEAMACEVPVIVTDVDGFREVVDNGNSGIIVPKKNYKAIAYEINNVIKGKYPNIGKLERNRVEKLYDWDENVKEMEKIYKKAIDLGREV